jgi:acetolactate synthase-1/3 small subunit
MSKHTIVALVEDKPGVLNRIANKWRQRGFNIETLAVGHSELEGLSRMTFTVDGTTTDVDQVTKQMYKIIEVVKVTDLTERETVSRELALVKVTAGPQNRADIVAIAAVFRANVIDASPDSMIVEATGTEDKVDALVEMLKPYGLKELVRTGRVAMSRGGGTTVSIDGAKHEHHRYRPAGEGKPKVGSLL